MVAKSRLFSLMNDGFSMVISSPEPKAHKVSLQDGHAPLPVRRPFTISKIFFSETAWPIKVELHVEHP